MRKEKGNNNKKCGTKSTIEKNSSYWNQCKLLKKTEPVLSAFGSETTQSQQLGSSYMRSKGQLFMYVCTYVHIRSEC